MNGKFWLICYNSFTITATISMTITRGTDASVVYRSASIRILTKFLDFQQYSRLSYKWATRFKLGGSRKIIVFDLASVQFCINMHLYKIPFDIIKDK